MNLRKLFLLILIVLCVTESVLAWEDGWVETGGKYSPDSGDYQVDLPPGWKRVGNLAHSVQMTRDGLSLQEILLTKRPIEEAFPNTKKTLRAEMLPQEVAQVLLDDLMSNPNVTNQTTQENVPDTIDQHSGFRLVYSFKSKNGLTKKAVHYGFFEGTSLFVLRYEAAAKYYFARDLPAFEKVKDSFRLLKKPPSP